MYTDLINATEAAALLKVCRATLFRLVTSGEVESFSLARPGVSRGARRFSLSNLLTYLNRVKAEQRPGKKSRLPTTDHAASLREGNELRAQIARLKKDLKRALTAGGVVTGNLSKKAAVDPEVLKHVATLETLRGTYLGE